MSTITTDKKDSLAYSRIKEKMDLLFEEDAFEHLECWFGDDLSELMADAAFAVLKANKDVQGFMKRENLELFGD